MVWYIHVRATTYRNTFNGCVVELCAIARLINEKRINQKLNEISNENFKAIAITG